MQQRDMNKKNQSKKFNFLAFFGVTPTDKDQRSNDLKEYEIRYLSRYKKKIKSKHRKLSSPKPKFDDHVGGLHLRKHFVSKRKELKLNRLEYEKKYLARYDKQQKAKQKKSSNLKYDDDLGRFSLRKHFVNKRRGYLAKRKDYEEKYILLYMKKLGAKLKKSSSKKLNHDLISGRLNLREQIEQKRKELQTERKSFEKKFISRYKQPKTRLGKSRSLTKPDDDLGRLSFRKHIVTKRNALLTNRQNYEKEYLARYLKQQKTKRKEKKLQGLFT